MSLLGSVASVSGSVARATSFALLLQAAAGEVAAAEISVTPFAGYRWGGVITEIGRRVELDLRASSSFGVAVDFAIAPGRRIELRFSRQRSDFKATGLNIDERLLDVDVDKLHLGGMRMWAGDEVRPFVVVSAGTTSFRPRSADVTGDTRFSLGFGGGTQLVLNPIASIRLEARVFSILTPRGLGALCLGEECQLGYAGRNIMFQGELAAGLSVSF